MSSFIKEASGFDRSSPLFFPEASLSASRIDRRFFAPTGRVSLELLQLKLMDAPFGLHLQAKLIELVSVQRENVDNLRL